MAFKDEDIYSAYGEEVTGKHIQPAHVKDSGDRADFLGNYTAIIPSFADLFPDSRHAETACSHNLDGAKNNNQQTCLSPRGPATNLPRGIRAIGTGPSYEPTH